MAAVWSSVCAHGRKPSTGAAAFFGPCPASANAGVEAQVVDRVNAGRVAQGWAAYAVDGRLTATARVNAADVACNHITSHTG